jgi:hypothetical protein
MSLMGSPDRKTLRVRLVLRSDMILPGDVLLSHGGEKFSRLVDRYTGSRGYSHAALCTSRSFTYESDGNLIGKRPIYPVAYDVRKDAQYSLAPGCPISFSLFRHPKMPQLPLGQWTSQFERAYEKLAGETYGGDYSKLSRLAGLAQTDVVRHLLFSSYAQLKDKWGRKQKVNLSFCSELVARFFVHLGLQLFRDDRKPERVTPQRSGRRDKMFTGESPGRRGSVAA